MEETKKGAVSNRGDPSTLDFLDPALAPPGEDGDEGKSAIRVEADSPLYKYDLRGYKLPIDEQGRWIRTTGNWRPSCYSPNEWNKLSKVEKDFIREAYKDAQKVLHIDDDTVANVAVDVAEDFDAMSDSGEAYHDAGIADGCIDPETAANKSLSLIHI